MSVHYILDGYNVSHKLPQLAEKSLEDARDSLVKMIEIERPQGSLKNSVTIVFDGQEGIWGGTTTSFVKIIFTKGETADDKIKEMIEEAQNKRQCFAVTDDREIQIFARNSGAQFISVRDFFVKTKKKTTSRILTGSGSDQARVSKVAEHKINKEFEKIWLKE